MFMIEMYFIQFNLFVYILYGFILKYIYMLYKHDDIYLIQQQHQLNQKPLSTRWKLMTLHLEFILLNGI